MSYAPDPKDEKVYTNLQNFTLASVGSEDIQRLTDPTFIQADNQDALITYNIVNQAANRRGLPMPDTGKIIQTTGDAARIQFQPEKGETWLFVGGDILETGTATFSVNFQLYDSAGRVTYLGSASTTGQEPITADNLYKIPALYVTNELYLYANVTAGEGRISTAFVQTY